MKNAKNMLVLALMVMTSAAYANTNSSTYKVEEKVKVTGLNKALPASLPVLESPAPQNAKSVVDAKHNATQKAAIVGLQLKSNTTK